MRSPQHPDEPCCCPYCGSRKCGWQHVETIGWPKKYIFHFYCRELGRAASRDVLSKCEVRH